MKTEHDEKLRRTLERTPEATRWGRVLDLVERCADDAELAQTVRTLQMQMSSWRPRAESRWVPTGTRQFPVATGSAWHSAIPSGVLQVAPIDWIEEMSSGARSPKYRLIRALHLQGLELTSEQITALVSCPDLTNLRRLDTRGQRLDAAFFEALGGPSMPRLEHLLLSSLSSYGLRAIEHTDHPGTIGTLTVKCSHDQTSPEAFRTFLGMRCAQHVDEVHLERDHQERLLAVLDDPKVLPKLHTLGIRTHVAVEARAALGHLAFKRVERACLSLTIEVHRSADRSALARHFAASLNIATKEIRGIRHLDLTGLTPSLHMTERHRTAEHVPDAMTDALSAWETPRDLELLTLGPWWSEAIAEWLEHERDVRAFASADEAF